jgi:murein DD-endopeptidase MepM/ murein hydrolase activator NlpD
VTALTKIGSSAVAGEVSPEATKRADAKKAAQQLEAFFVRKLLSEAMPEGSAALGGNGVGAGTFRSMFDEAMADSITAGGGFGMADQFAKQLGDDPTTTTVQALMDGPMPMHRPAPAIAMPAAEVIARHQATTGDAGVAAGGARFAMPIEGARFSSSFGPRIDPVDRTTHSMHAGLDLRGAMGTPVGAAAGGVVTRAEMAGTYGNLVVIKHPDGLETRYAHLSAIGVQKGDTVTAGQEVGKVGSTGHSTGPHLHFEVRQDGKPIDPKPLLDQTQGRSNQ